MVVVKVVVVVVLQKTAAKELGFAHGPLQSLLLLLLLLLLLKPSL